MGLNLFCIQYPKRVAISTVDRKPKIAKQEEAHEVETEALTQTVDLMMERLNARMAAGAMHCGSARCTISCPASLARPHACSNTPAAACNAWIEVR
jgi:hypothetical protein